MQILWHFPHTKTDSFKPQYDRIEWRNNEEDFNKWCIGETGYPLVDAGMRELNQTGFLQNRLHPIASLLKDAYIENYRLAYGHDCA